MRNDRDVIFGAIIMGVIVLASIVVVVLLLMSDDPFGEKIERSITLEQKNINEEIITGTVREVSIKAITKNVKDKLVWSTNNENVAVVKADGESAVITLKAAGTAVITVKSGNLSAKCEVVVKEVESRITILPNKIEEGLVKDNTKVITLMVNLENINGQLEWLVDNDKVASIKGNGTTAELTLKEAGEAVVTVKLGEKLATCNVKVNEELSMISLNATNINKEIAVDSTDEQILEAILVNVTGELTWSSSNEKVVKVERIDETKAKITLLGKGNAIVTVTDGVVKTNCYINVKHPEPILIIKHNNKSVVNQTITEELKQGKTETLVLVPELINISGDVNWKSSNEKVATIIKSGTTAKIVIKNIGTSAITLTVGDKSVTCNLNVILEENKDVK